jgi:hypothetical protein
MRAILCALLLIPSAALANDVKRFTADGANPPGLVAAGKCEKLRMRHAAKPDAAVRMRPLEQEAAANAYYPVLRLKDGCDEPVIIGEKIGGGPDAER